MTEHVLDASALLALMLGERGADQVLETLPAAVIGAVNLAEVVAKLQERGVPDAEIDRNLAELDLPVVPFDRALAMAAGKLRSRTRSRGLSLGDRACLALAKQFNATALTADRPWTRLDPALGIAVVCIRE